MIPGVAMAGEKKAQNDDCCTADFNARLSELERVEAAVEAAGFDIWENNWQTGETFGTNRRTFSALGYSEDELPKSVEETLLYIHPDDRALSLQIVQDYFSGKTSSYFAEFRLKAKDGNWVWYANSGKVISRDENGKPIRFVGMSYNIHARKIAEQEREEAITKLQAALAEIKTLQGILPICAVCKKIRDDKGFWNQVEAYLAQHTGAQFSHGMCPDCVKAYYPDISL
jgi:PAS domain S-box-containing protein